LHTRPITGLLEQISAEKLVLPAWWEVEVSWFASVPPGEFRGGIFDGYNPEHYFIINRA
jgi:hypothetical protein